MRLAVWTVAAFLAAASAPARADAPPASRSSAPQARLVRVLGGGQQALLLDRNQGAYVLVRVGDQLQGLRVTEIGPYQIVLAHADGRRHYVLPLVPGQQQTPTAAAVRPEPAPATSSSSAPVNPYAGAAAAPANPAPPLDPYAGAAAAPSASPAPPLNPYASAPAAAADTAPLDPYAPKDAAAPIDPAPVDPYGQPIPAVPAPPGSRAQDPAPARAGRKATALEPPVVRGAARRDAAAERRTLSRRELDAALADFDALGKEMQLRVVPRRGVQILDLARGSLAHRLGLRAGDLVVSIAGRQVTSADDAAAAYVALDRAQSFAIVVERQGRRHTLRVALTP